jgi:hypothetical protein
METTIIIIILAIVLIGFFVLNYMKTMQTETSTTSTAASCSQTTFGCCPDGINSKINYYGTNCPSYVPPPGYLPTHRPLPPPHPLPPPPHPLPPPPHPIYPVPRPIVGGCAGTQYGCCPDNVHAKIDAAGSNCIV